MQLFLKELVKIFKDALSKLSIYINIGPHTLLAKAGLGFFQAFQVSLLHAVFLMVLNRVSLLCQIFFEYKCGSYSEAQYFLWIWVQHKI